MNILYISKLTGFLWAGPNSSVPSQINAQSKIDNVFWYNLNMVNIAEWKLTNIQCKSLVDYPSGRLEDLPVPFNMPDLVVIQEFYTFPFERIINDFQIKKIPYIIVPRSTLTKQAQKHKYLKKVIGNLVYFKKLARQAASIHYLTDDEFKESGIKWNKNYFIIPNGINIPRIKIDKKLGSNINAVYIGRVEVYQKGLDMLFYAISEIKYELRKVNFVLNIYGPDREGSISILKKLSKELRIDNLVNFENPVFKKEKEEVLLRSDLFILTSRFEGLSMGLLEALSYGLPCIVTSGTNMMREIKEFNAGWTSDNSIDGIKNSLISMINSKDLIEKGKNAKLLAKEYSWSAIAKRSHSHYLDIVRKSIKKI